LNKIHTNLVWMRLSERLSETLGEDPQVSALVALRLDRRTFAVRPEHYPALRKVLIKRGLLPQERGQWTG